jgi:hypothetical protein
MKKLFVAATLGIALVSCGGPSVCDCMQWEKEYRAERKAADGDDAKKAIKESYKDKMEQCEKLAEGKSEDEMKEMMKEAESCK